MTDRNGNLKEIWLIIICWIAYVFAQIGRDSYGSNVTLIIDKFGVEHAEASLPATLFFFAYGIGQILVGIFCHKFNRKILVVSALVLSGAINLVVFFGAPFLTIKYLWFLNGFAQANLWPVMLLIIRENVSAKRMTTAGVVMSTASTGGKFVAIGVCAVFAINTERFMYCFLTAGILLLSMALVFLFATGRIKKPERTEPPEELPRETAKRQIDKKSIILLILLGVFALNCYAISGGLQSWVPSIIKENFGMSDSLSIFMSILLPLFTLPVAVIAPFLNKKFKGNYILTSLVAFVVGGILVTGVLLFLDVNWLPVIILFTMEALSMGIISNTTTVQVPLTFKGKFDAGFLAGYLNGACYVGMAASTYVLGVVADGIGWTGAIVTLICIAAISAVLAAVYLIFNGKHKKEKDYDGQITG